MCAIRRILAAGPNHLGAAQPLTVATSDTLPPLLHTQVIACLLNGNSLLFECVKIELHAEGRRAPDVARIRGQS